MLICTKSCCSSDYAQNVCYVLQCATFENETNIHAILDKSFANVFLNMAEMYQHDEWVMPALTSLFLFITSGPRKRAAKSHSTASTPSCSTKASAGPTDSKDRPVNTGKHTHVGTASTDSQHATGMHHTSSDVCAKDLGQHKCEVCATCSKTAADVGMKRLFKCSGCTVAPRYCTAECQKANWAAHKAECKVNRKNKK
jgi:hypothetical protein